MTPSTFIIALISYLHGEGLCFEMQLLKAAFRHGTVTFSSFSPYEKMPSQLPEYQDSNHGKLELEDKFNPHQGDPDTIPCDTVPQTPSPGHRPLGHRPPAAVLEPIVTVEYVTVVRG